MKLKKTILIPFVTLGLGLVSSAFATHGALGSVDRDAWIDSRVDALVSAGWVSRPALPTRDLTNLQVAMLVAEAAPAAEASMTSSATVAAKKGHQELVTEFKDDLDAMSDELAKREDHLTETRGLIHKMRAATQDALRKTGTQISGQGRFYVANYRGFGKDKVYADSDWNNILWADIRLRSVPVPAILFDTTFRVTRTLGMPYNDPIAKEDRLRLRWIALTCSGKPGSLTFGDFFKSYTRLTLWNYDVPVYTLLEPTSLNRIRKSLEADFFLDHGNDWRMRGIDAWTDQSLENAGPLSSFKAQVMGGMIQNASETQFAQEYGGTQVGLGFCENRLFVKATGLLLQDDLGTTSMVYDPTEASTWARHQMVGSLSANGAVTLTDDWKVEASGEYARSRFQDDRNIHETQLKDWAVLSDGSVQWKDLRVGLKYLNVGPLFYSPGAQTNRYSAGYEGITNVLEDGLDGYRGAYVFNRLTRPTFDAYDRLLENVLPYGDATPNREGFILSGSAKVGMDGWVQPRFSVGFGLKEFEPDYVLTGTSDYVLPVDSRSNTGVARTFQHLEGALTLDFSKLVEKLPATCALNVDYKHQSSDPGLGDDPFKVDTLSVFADAGPFKKAPVVGALVFSAAFEMVQARGREFVLSDVGNPSSLSRHCSRFTTSDLGAFSYSDLNIDRTTFAFGFKWPLSKTFRVYGDWLSRKYVWKDHAGYDRRDQIWKLTHELSF